MIRSTRVFTLLLVLALASGCAVVPTQHTGVLETFGGLLIVLGLLTRPAAFLLAGEMAYAYFESHAPRGFWPLRNGGELAVFFCCVFLHLSVVGAGPFSVDAALRRRRDPRIPASAPLPTP